jgi:tripartite-type tricarboxylate transporter receptor subunit TctC
MGILFLGILTLFFTVHSSWAKYPDKKIRFIVAFGPGGMGDITCRAIVRSANPHLQNRLYIENIVGAGGAVGWRECAKSAPDGYTITNLLPAIMIGPHVAKGFPTDDLFDPICIMALESRMLVVKMDSRFQTIQDLVSYAKAHPGDLTVATGGPGSADDLGAVAFADAAGVKLTRVPYTGAGPALVAALGGHVDIAVTSPSGTKSYVEAKQIRILVTLGAKRYLVYPEVPTAKELGYDVALVAFSGVGVPRGVPNEVKEILVEAFRKAAEDESYKKFIAGIGLEQVFFPPKTAALWLNEQREFFKKLTEKLGMKPE